MESGQVVRTDGGLAWVRLTPSGACEGCGAKLVCQPKPTGERELAVYNQVAAQPGQKVQIQEIHHLTLRLSLMQFGLPLLGLILGVNLAPKLPVPLPLELWQAICGFSVMGLAGVLTYLWSKRESRKGPAFSIERILEPTQHQPLEKK